MPWFVILSCSLCQIKKGRNACLLSSALTKVLRSACQIKKRSKNGFKVVSHFPLLYKRLIIKSFVIIVSLIWIFESHNYYWVTSVSILRWLARSVSDSPLSLSRGSYSNLHPAAEVGAALSSPWGPAEAQGAPAEAADGGGEPDGEDEGAPDGQWEQTETAGGYEEGTILYSNIKTDIQENFWLSSSNQLHNSNVI